VQAIDLKPNKESERQVDTVARALELLACFSDAEPELTLKQLSEKTGLYKSRILRLCGTLSAGGFLIRLPRAAYKLGPMLMILGKVYERSNPLANVVRPILKTLSEKTGESTKLFVIEGHKRLCLAREKGPSPLRYAISEGQTLELYAGAGGKVLLAFAAEDFRNRILRRKLAAITANTIVTREQLEEEFASIRKLGYAVSMGELVPDVAGLAAPVFDHDGKACGALTISGPTQRFSPARRKEMLVHLLAATREVALLLGHPNPD
jgi:DNA-binding IclR family transcriptional regulator